MYTVTGRMGGAFNSGGGAGAFVVPSMRGAVAAWKLALDELGRLTALK